MRLTMDARARRILRRLPRVNLYSVAELALMAAVAVQAARLIWVTLTPVAPVGDWRPIRPTAPSTEILSGFDPFFRLSAGGQPAAVTSLQLTLFGTRVDEAMGRGSAILAGPDGVQKSFSVGEEVSPGVRLKAVAFDHVTIDRGGAAEDLFLDQSGAVTPVTPTASAIGAPSMPTAQPPSLGSSSADRLRSEIGFIPRIDDGRISGLVVRAQGSGALFRQAGLRDGDVVTAIGGRPVTGPQDVDRVGGDLRGAGSIPVTVERGRQTLSLAIPVTSTP